MDSVPRNPALQVRLPADAFRRLATLRQERHLNVSAWARQVLLDALHHDFPETDAPDEPPHSGTDSPPAPLPGWHPARLPGGGWGSACDRPASLPAQLVGLSIEVQPRQGAPWTATILEVVRRDDGSVLVRDTGRPDPHSGK